MRIDLIVVPYDSGRRGERMGAGPERLLKAGLPERLERDGNETRVDVVELEADTWRTEAGSAFDLARGVAAAVSASRSAGGFPLVLSGNCGPAAIGCTAGLAGSPAVFWFDAHGDLNTPETTASGFVDGMALATVTGRCWARLAAGVPGFAAVPDTSVVLLGARDIDALEAALLAGSAIPTVTAEALRGDPAAALAVLGDPRAPGYVHVDLDVLDPAAARINAYAATGGLTETELTGVVDAICGGVPVAAAALTAYDPSADPDGNAADVVVRVAVSLARSVARAAGAARDGGARERAE